MSFRCDNCDAGEPAHATPNKVVTKYYLQTKKLRDENGDETGEVTSRRDIKQEQDWCDLCFLSYDPERRGHKTDCEFKVGGSKYPCTCGALQSVKDRMMEAAIKAATPSQPMEESNAVS